MALKAGTVADFDDSMAEAIEKAFKKEWLNVKKSPLPELGKQDRRMILAAIAQGVIKYLKDNAESSLKVEVHVTQDATGGPWMATKGATVTGIHTHEVKSTQVKTTTNKIKSKSKY